MADGDAAAITGALDEMQTNIGAQLTQMADAEAKVTERLQKLGEAEAALADVQAAADQQTQFILEVRNWLTDPKGALQIEASSPEEAARIQSMAADLNAKIGEIEAAEQARETEAARQAALPRLHFEYHPGGGGAVNPYPRLAEVCDR